MKGFDRMVADLGISRDEETVEFLVDNRVQQLWQQACTDTLTFAIDRFRSEPGDRYFTAIAARRPRPPVGE
jgi:hypothetical protein